MLVDSTAIVIMGLHRLLGIWVVVIIAMRRSRAEVLDIVDVELGGQWEGC